MRKLEFLGYGNSHKGFKCLDVSTGRIYISRDVIFHETILPFAELHPNVGACLQSEILLLPSHLLNSSGIEQYLTMWLIVIQMLLMYHIPLQKV